MKSSKTPPSEQLVQSLVGRYLLFRQPMKPQSLLHIDPCIYRATSVRSKRQLMLQPQGAETKPRKWTRVGEHIAFSFASLEAAEEAAELIAQHALAAQQAERKLQEALAAL